MTLRKVVSISLLILGVVALASAADYKVVNTWKLGGDGGWDYIQTDSDGHRLFIARATRVMVIDTASGKQVGEIPDTPGVHGIALDAADGCRLGTAIGGGMDQAAGHAEGGGRTAGRR